MLRLFHLKPREATRGSVRKRWTEMVRRFGFPTLDAAIYKVEYPGLDLSRVRRPTRDQEGRAGPGRRSARGLSDMP